MVTPITIKIDKETLESSDHVAIVVSFKGELDESNIDDSAKKIYDLIEDTPKDVGYIFDFGELNYMNSKSIGYLSDWFTRIQERGALLFVANPRDNIKDILRTVGLDNFIKMYHTVDDAKLALIKRAGGEKKGKGDEDEKKSKKKTKKK